MLTGPSLYIMYMENGEHVKHGPYWTISPDGNGAAIGEGWVAYCVQSAKLCFQRIIIPTRYHTIISR